MKTGTSVEFTTLCSTAPYPWPAAHGHGADPAGAGGSVKIVREPQTPPENSGERNGASAKDSTVGTEREACEESRK